MFVLLKNATIRFMLRSAGLPYLEENDGNRHPNDWRMSIQIVLEKTEKGLANLFIFSRCLCVLIVIEKNFLNGLKNKTLMCVIIITSATTGLSQCVLRERGAAASLGVVGSAVPNPASKKPSLVSGI